MCITEVQEQSRKWFKSLLCNYGHTHEYALTWKMPIIHCVTDEEKTRKEEVHMIPLLYVCVCSHVLIHIHTYIYHTFVIYIFYPKKDILWFGFFLEYHPEVCSSEA
jgi:hypothetical protein